MTKDFLGNELEVGMEVLYWYSWSKELMVGNIKRMTDKTVWLEKTGHSARTFRVVKLEGKEISNGSW